MAILLTRLTRLPGVVSASLTTHDGLPIAHAGPDADQGIAGAASAALFGAAQRSAAATRIGQPTRISVQSSAYTLHLQGVGELVISAVAHADADLAKLDAELTRVSGVLARIEKGSPGGADPSHRQA